MKNKAIKNTMTVEEYIRQLGAKNRLPRKDVWTELAELTAKLNRKNAANGRTENATTDEKIAYIEQGIEVIVNGITELLKRTPPTAPGAEPKSARRNRR